MDLTSGIFTAPGPGIYFFSFAAVAHLESSSGCWCSSYLILNGNLIGQSHISEYNSNVNQMSPLTLQSTLNLQKGDRVWVQIDYSCSLSYLYEYDSNTHLTHFTGFMLEEEIVAYL